MQYSSVAGYIYSKITYDDIDENTRAVFFSIKLLV